MAQSDFRLATLLRVRERERSERRAELAIAVQREQTAQEHAARLEFELARTRSTVVNEGHTADLTRLQAGDRFQRLLRRELEQARRDHQQAVAEMEIRRQAVVAADQQVRALEKLRERYQAEFERQQNVLAQRELDEAASRGWHHFGPNSGVASAG